MTTTARRVFAAALVTLGVAAAPAFAEESKLATFDVQLKGVQESNWEYHHTAQHACDTNSDDYGRETYRFHSRKLRVQAFWDGRRVFLSTARGPATLRVRGKVNREAELHHSPGGKCNVGGGGGGTPQEQPLDCGIRRVRQKVTIDYSALREDFLVIDDGMWDFQSPFSNCPAGSYQFPRLLTLTTGGDVIGQELPAEDLMRYGTSIVVARGVNKSRVAGAEQSYYASIRWTATFTRVRGH